MSKWPKYPTIYEINTWVWLSDLSEKSGIPTDLRSVRAPDWDAIAKFGFDAVWLMGAWWLGVGLRTGTDVLLWLISATVPFNPACRFRGAKCKGKPGIYRMLCRMQTTTATATKCCRQDYMWS